MQARVDWILKIFGTQVTKQKRPVRPVFPDYLSVSYDYASIEMLSFLHLWDCCWKCEFDTDVKIETYYHHDGEQTGFYKKLHIKTQSKKNNVFVIFILQETKNSNLFEKNCTQENVKYNIQHKETWLRWILIEQIHYK